MNHKNTVSIITPAFNCAGTILEVVKSIEQQTSEILEFIIVDDGSTDETSTILKLLSQQSEIGIQIVTQPNSGESAAVNQGVAIARGDYVMVINADDPILPNCIEHLRTALDRNPKAVVSYADWKMIDVNGEEIEVRRTLEFSLDALVGDWVCIVGPGAMIRRSAFKGMNARDLRYRLIGDYEMWLRLASVGTFVRVNETLSTWRSHSGGASWNYRGLAIAKQYEMLLKDYFSRSDLDPEVLRLQKRAKAHAFYYIGLQKLFDHRVAGRRMILRSWIGKPVMRYHHEGVRRSFLGSVAVLSYPISLEIASATKALGFRFPPLIEDAISKYKADKSKS